MIFVSYDHDDRARVEALVKALKKSGLRVRWDREIWGEDGYREALAAAIEEATQVVVVWTKSSRRSRWVQDEAECALESKKLVQVRFDAVRPPLGFGADTYLDLLSWGKVTRADELEFEGFLAALVDKHDAVQSVPVSITMARKILEFLELLEALAAKMPELLDIARIPDDLRRKLDKKRRAARFVTTAKVVGAVCGLMLLLGGGTAVAQMLFPPEPEVKELVGAGGAAPNDTGGAGGQPSTSGSGGSATPASAGTTGASGAGGVAGTSGAGRAGAGPTAPSAKKKETYKCCHDGTGSVRQCNKPGCEDCDPVKKFKRCD